MPYDEFTLRLRREQAEVVLAAARGLLEETESTLAAVGNRRREAPSSATPPREARALRLAMERDHLEFEAAELMVTYWAGRVAQAQKSVELWASEQAS